MSKQASVEFFAKINTDTALQQEVTTAIQGQGDEPMLMEAAHCIAEVGRKYGYDFTSQEAAETYLEIMEMQNQQIQGLREDEEELNDHELDLVAGGAGAPKKVKNLKQESTWSVDFDMNTWNKQNAQVVDKGKVLNYMGQNMAAAMVNEGKATTAQFCGVQGDKLYFKGFLP